jgi:hypothetical protein
MAGDGEETSPNRINRREALKRAAIATGVAWSAPVLTSLRTPAFAQYGPPCETGCRYVAQFIRQEDGSLSPCFECTGPICFNEQCGTCAGPACPHVQLSFDDATRRGRVCVDCVVDFTPETGPPFVTMRCPDPADCTGVNVQPDPDPRCFTFDDGIFFGCPGLEYRIEWTCASC